jgi:hypothetical protein
MEPHIQKMLAMEEQPDNIVRLRDDIRRMLKYSRSQMKRRHEAWDRNAAVFNGKRDPDLQDDESRSNSEPEKMVVPMSYTQVMTGTTFSYMMLCQNKTFFQLDATGNEDYPITEASEQLLERDLRHNQWKPQLFELLTDFYRFGITATKTTWVIETQYVELTPEPEPAINAGPFSLAPPPSIPVLTPMTKYEGNKVVKISPYRLLPDMRLPLTRWREGKFVADETEYHIDTLKTMEKEGLLAGVEFVTKMESKTYSESGRADGRFKQVEATWEKGEKKDDDSFMVILTEGDFLINPSKYDLGSDDYECHYIITMANDGRITSIEKSGYLHGDFIYDIAQFSPDEHSECSLALSDVIDKLQETITWLINARIISLRQGLDRHLIGRPEWIDMDALEGRQPFIGVRPGAPQMEMNKLIGQLKIDDKSGQNMAEAESLTRIIQVVTGVNENAMGQYAPGRRSATENRNANAGAASRMTLHTSLFAEQLVQPQGRKMLTNLRQGISYESFSKIVGETSPTTFGEIPITLDQLFEEFAPSDPVELVGNEDFFIFDMTSSSERAYLAQNLQELVIALSANPAIAQLTQYDITKLIDEILFLRGVRNPARFKRPLPAVNPVDAAAAEAAAGLGAPPDEGGADSPDVALATALSE